MLSFSWLSTSITTGEPIELPRDEEYEANPEVEAQHEEALQMHKQFMQGYNAAKFVCDIEHTQLLDAIVREIYLRMTIATDDGMPMYFQGQLAALKDVGLSQVAYNLQQ